jgi:hypothetical protein
VTFSRQRFTQWLLYALEIQLFVTLFALPLLLAWGIPLSWATIVGNILFAPVLTVFLLLCTLMFFTELFHIPNDWLMPIFDWYSQTWIWLLHHGSRKWLIFLPCPSLLILLTIGAIALGILLTVRFTLFQRIGVLILLLVTIITGLQQQNLPTSSLELPIHNKVITIMHKEGRTAFIDEGILQRSSDSWVRYTFLPAYTKQFGAAALDYCIVTKPSVRTLQRLSELCKTISIKTIYLPAWIGKGSVHWWHALGHLRTTCKREKTELVPIGTQDILLPWGNGSLIIHPHKPLIRVSGLQIPKIEIRK